MGFLGALGLSRKGVAATQYSKLAQDIASPWAEGNLSQIAVGDIFGDEIVAHLPLTRAAAMSIPAVSRARNLLVSQIARLPLKALDSNGVLPDTKQPTFLYRSNDAVSPYDRMVWTVDDLIFYGCALWRVTRGAENAILTASWVPQDEWTVRDGLILIDDEEVDESEVILFNSPFEGLLNIAARTLRGAIDTENAWTGRMRNPIPLIVLKVTDDSNLDQTEVDEYVTAWAKARRSIDGAVGFLPPGMDMDTHGEVDPALFLEGRNAIRTDVGSFLNVRASMLDGTSSVDSLTYVTKDGERNSFFEIDLPFWTDPIAQTLSQDNVVPRGQRVRFDFTEQTQSTPTPTGAPEQD